MADGIGLTKAELANACAQGRARRDYDKARGLKDRWNFEGTHEEGVDNDEMGAIGECAVAKYFALKWIGFNPNFRQQRADVGEMFEVRATNFYDGGLLLHDSDKDDLPFIATRTNLLPFWVPIMGWMWGREGKQKYWWEDGTNIKKFKKRPCYIVPADKLRPMKELMVILTIQGTNFEPPKYQH